MALNSLGLGIVLSAKDEASRVFDNVRRSFLKLNGASDDFVEKMENNAKRLKVGLALMGAGVAGLGTSLLLANEAGKFEAAMTNLQVISQASAKQMDLFRDAVLNADKSMFGPVESANALRELAQQGFTASEALTMLKPVLDLATASLGELGITDASMVAAQAIKAFGLDAKDTTKIVDEMSKSANISALSFRDLPIGIGVMARGAKALDQTFEESLITLGLVRNTIPTIERASHAATISMERLAGGRHAKMLQALVPVFEKNTGAIRPFLDIINDLVPKLDAMSVKNRKAFLIKSFGAEGLAGVQAIMTQLQNGITTTNGTIVKGADAIAYLREQVAKSQGTASSIAAKQLETLPGQMKLLEADFERLKVVLGGPFAAALKPLVEGFGKLVTFVKNAFEKVPANMQKGIAQFILLASAVTTVVGAFMTGSALMTLFGVTLGSIASAAMAVLTPLLLIAAGIGGVVALVSAFKVSSEQTGHGVVQYFTEMWNKTKLLFQGLMQLFQEGGFSGAVMDEFNKAENSGVKAFAVKVFLWVNRIENFLGGLVDGFKEKIRDLQPIFDRVTDALGMLTESLGLTVGETYENTAAFDSAGASGQSLGSDIASLAGVLGNLLFVSLLVTKSVLDMVGSMQNMGLTVGGSLDIIIGALEILFGILTGDWNTTWKGAFNIAFGLMDGLVGVIFNLAKGVAYLTDSFNKMAGIGFTDNVDQINDTIKAYKRWSAETKAEGLNMAGVPESKPFDMFATHKILGPDGKPVNAQSGITPPTPQNNPGITAANTFIQGGNDGLMFAFGQYAQSQEKKPVVVNVTSLLKLDQVTLAQAFQKITAEAAARGQIPVFSSDIHP